MKRSSNIKSPILYKYSDSRWADSIVRGEFKISLLNEFQTMENADLRDEKEGVIASILSGTYEFGPGKNEHIIKNLNSTGMFDIPLTASGIFGDIGFVQHAPPIYTLCFSLDISNQKMQSQVGYDALFEIPDLVELAKEITRRNVNYLGLPIGVGPVRYDQRIFDLTRETPVMEPFLKRIEFADEKEFRFCWRALKTDPYFIANGPIPSGLVRRIR